MKNEKINKSEELKQVALFRFSLIAPLVNNCHAFNSKSEFFRNVASKTYTLPNGKNITIAQSTLKKWYMNYLKHGFETLIPKTRNDTGYSRTISVVAIERINELKTSLPYVTGKAIYKKLIEEGLINSKDVSIASLYRYLNSHHLRKRPSVERRSFQMEFANDCWQCDTSHRSLH